MSLESIVSFLLIIIVFAITPGPGVMALMARSLSSGAGACVSMSFGMAVSDVLYLVAACLGLAVLAELWSGFFLAVRFAGSLYLIYLGWNMWKNSSTLTSTDDTVQPVSAKKGFYQGFLISASNPKVVVFYLAVLPTIVELDTLKASGIALISVITICGLMTGLMMVSLFASSIRRYIAAPAARARLNKTSGGIMIGAGACLGING